jgi:hypothetical protein
MADTNVRHLARQRHEVVHQRTREQVALLVIAAGFEERCADPMKDAAADLLVEQERLDDAAAILEAPVLQKRDDPGVGIDLEVAGLDAVRRDPGFAPAALLV